MKLSNDSLHEKLISLTREERGITLQILHHFREAESRKLFALRGHPSLFEYAVVELKYSEGSAQRRISAMRLLRELPELEEKVASGILKVTQLSQIQTFLRSEVKTGQKYSLEAKRELVLATIGKSTREVAKTLNPDRTESISVDPEALSALKEVRDRFAHELPSGASLSDVIRFLAKRALANDPMKKPSKVVNSPPALVKHSKVKLRETPPVKNTRFIPLAIKRGIWKKEPEGCAYISSINEKRCASRHRLQIDHIRPFSLGGSSRDPQNLRFLCATHNRVTWKTMHGN